MIVVTVMLSCLDLIMVEDWFGIGVIVTTPDRFHYESYYWLKAAYHLESVTEHVGNSCMSRWVEEGGHDNMLGC